MISPCKCQGSLQYIHKECLEKSLIEPHIYQCSICKDDYIYQDTQKSKMIYRIALLDVANPLVKIFVCFNVIVKHVDRYIEKYYDTS